MLRLSMSGLSVIQQSGRNPISNSLHVRLLERKVVVCQIDRLVIYRQRMMFFLFFFAEFDTLLCMWYEIKKTETGLH
jgi:hypothetical protein